ncbi:MAG: hypothetical protein AABX80_01970 [Nanoarchaeota archaeon]
MTNKIIGLKLEEIVKFDSKKFSSCIVRYTGKCGGNSFEKEISIQEILAIYKSLYAISFYTKNDKKILNNPHLKELVFGQNSEKPYGNIVAKVSEYDLIRA